jgi:nicotinate-nucleotide pyrophosphorylase (carboxylating)
MQFEEFILQALAEDIGAGDHSTLCCIPVQEMGSAQLKVKEEGILAGASVAERIVNLVDPNARIELFISDGSKIRPGDKAFELHASVHTILKIERLLLNIMQRMSGIATLTNTYVQKLENYKTQLLDTRKTTPNFRWFEKEAVRLGGGVNHRMGLYDMIMLKDNHIDYCGGIEKAITLAHTYRQEKNLSILIEVETRSLDDVQRAVQTGQVDRIMLDNFPIEKVKEAVDWIQGRVKTEASGGITLETIEAYAATGVDYVSVGAVIHHASSLDLSLKAIKT